MNRNFGLGTSERYFSEEDFKDGCNFNLYIGMGIGTVLTVALELFGMWLAGWF